MYALKVQSNVPPIFREAYAARLRATFDFQARMPGFREARNLQSLGYPTRYTTLAYYDSREAVDAIYYSKEFREVTLATPLEGVTVIGTAEAFEVEIDVTAPGGTSDITQVALAELQVAPGIPEAEFVKVRSELFPLLQRHDTNLRRSRLLRFLGGGGRYVAVHANSGATDLPTLRTMPEVAAFYARYPDTKYLSAPPAAELFRPSGILARVPA